MPRLSWTKIAGLSDDLLKKEGEDVMVISPEESKKEKHKKKVIKEEPKPEKWLPHDYQGHLVVDLYEKESDLIIESTIAGVKTEDIDITVEPDLIVIRGERKKEEDKEKNYYYQECFWGKFSRTLVLPHPIKPEKVKANLKNGILTITLPIAAEKNPDIKIEEN